MGKENITRREFFKKAVGAAKIGIGIAIGDTVGKNMVEPSLAINRIVQTATNTPTGNAEWAEIKKQFCPDPNTRQECAKELYNSPLINVWLTYIAPSLEEFAYRAFVGFGKDILTKRKNPVNDAIFGIGTDAFTREEFICGMFNAIGFGLIHNQTNRGFDTKTIPASQTVMALVYWYSQRFGGIFCSIANHSGYMREAISRI